jgi:hypothetical protein
MMEEEMKMYGCLLIVAFIRSGIDRRAWMISDTEKTKKHCAS